MSFKPPKGTFDVIAGAPQVYRNAGIWRRVLAEWELWAARYGYPLVMTPVFEATELFERGVGDTTEVVTKQMYTFTDKGGRSVTLRPEGTAGVVRAYLDAGIQGAWKGAYSGAMFRYERPQKGRYRQFFQVGVEYLDVESPQADAEVIELGYRYLSAVGAPGLKVLLNSLGDPGCRPAYVSALRSYLEDRRDQLSPDSNRLIDRNPLRVLDSKVDSAKLRDAPRMADFLCGDCAGHYEEVKASLQSLQIPYTEDPALVRGLDYYTRTAFEYVATSLDAAQNAVGGGGRYDGLAESIGGRRTPGVGFALGVDRIVLSIEGSTGPELDIYLVSEVGPAQALAGASVLRRGGLRVDLDVEGRSIKAQFRAATKSGAPVTVVFRGMDTAADVRFGGERAEMPFDQIALWMEKSK